MLLVYNSKVEYAYYGSKVHVHFVCHLINPVFHADVITNLVRVALYPAGKAISPYKLGRPAQFMRGYVVHNMPTHDLYLNNFVMKNNLHIRGKLPCIRNIYFSLKPIVL